MEEKVHVMVTVVGARTEHWIELFAALANRPDVTVTVVAADVSELTRTELDLVSSRSPRFRYHVVPHLLGEGRTGHMASVLFRTDVSRFMEHRPDVVHIIGEAAYLSTWQVIRTCRRRWPGVPVSLYAAQNIVIGFPAPFPTIERYSYRQVDHMFPITPAALYVLRVKGYAGNASVVPLGVDPNLFRPGPTGDAGRRFTVGFVGRLEHHKGIADLLRAAESVDCDVAFIGEGALRPLVEQAIERRPGRIVLHSWADHHDLPGHLNRMDALALPSIEVVQRNVLPWVGIPLREQFGRVLVEAMACGTPVVGSDVGEIPHVIGDAGLTFTAGDWVSLANCLSRLRDDPELAARLSANGLARVHRLFSWESIADAMCDAWNGLRDAGDRRSATGLPRHRREPHRAPRATATQQLEAKP
ncbi:glycosyltransferase family 4 protein [Solwaraspora sp. WMMD937]|uniref:glycosyltransferase family 4 protein n=1 Tax=Solwaraspora sp. WMMD937 TaxID=3016090 RepID=UPI00249A182E|nr:glycosyltransferase family 4 protein [Solwaraspora sp. WMMD937]WFE21878.1 glycosyltransferase family 4 protein [Solwaraspora sp. WMMD937]